MASRRALRSGLVGALLVFLAQLVLSGCGDHSTPAADRCSEQSKPATVGERVTWEGVQFAVPVGWYPVSVCFLTGAPPPVDYLTTQPPHAQCSRISESAGRCGPPIDKVDDDGVLVVGTQTSTSFIEKVRPNAVVAGRPARVTTSPAGSEYSADQEVRADILLPHHQVLTVIAYVGPSASPERVLAMLHGARLSV
jgi:hypothetical protein